MNLYRYYLRSAIRAATPLCLEDLRNCAPWICKVTGEAQHGLKPVSKPPRGLAAADFYLTALRGARKCRPSKLRELKKLHRYLVRCNLGN